MGSRKGFNTLAPCPDVDIHFIAADEQVDEPVVASSSNTDFLIKFKVGKN
jgi:hypothetical protein